MSETRDDSENETRLHGFDEIRRKLVKVRKLREKYESAVFDVEIIASSLGIADWTHTPGECDDHVVVLEDAWKELEHAYNVKHGLGLECYKAFLSANER